MTLWQTFGKFVCSQSVTELIFRDANFNAARSSTYTEILAKLFSKKELTITHKNHVHTKLNLLSQIRQIKTMLKSVAKLIFSDANFNAAPGPTSTEKNDADVAIL